MNRLSLVTLIALLAALAATVAIAEELDLPKEGLMPPRTLNWEDVNGIDAFGDTNRNGDDYVEEGVYHGGQGSGDPIGPFGDSDAKSLDASVPIGLIGVRFGGR